MAIDQFTAHPLGNFATPGDWNGGVPGSTQDAEINSGAFVDSDVSETVKSIGVGSDNVLNIDGGPFETVNGTGPDSIASGGAIDIDGVTFKVDGGTIDNAGLIELNGGGSSLVLPMSFVTLDGGGTIQAKIGGGPSSNIIEDANLNFSVEFDNQDNTISGDVTIGNGLIFVNKGIVETNNSTSSGGGTVAILGTSGILGSNSGNFVNYNILRADSGGTIILGVDNVTGSIDNEANIDLEANTNASTELKIAGDMTITATAGHGAINLGGSDASAEDQIVSDGNPATLTLVNQTIKGAGSIGDADLTLDNQSGTIDAAGGVLELYAGQGPTINNGGTLEALSSSGFLFIAQNVDNTGTIQAANGGGVGLDGIVSGPGAIDIGANSAIVLSDSAQVTGNITFTGGYALLGIQDTLPNSVGGDLVGAAATDMIDFDEVQFSASNHLTWQQNGSAGTLSVVNSSNTTLTSINLAGTYTAAQFAQSSDGIGPNGGTLVTVLNPAPPSATTEVMIMDQTGTGNYEIYDLGGNAIQGSGPLGQLGTASVMQLGAFNGSDLYDMLMRDNSTGAFWMYDVSGNNVTNPGGTFMGSVGLSWSILGFGDFSGNAGETDMLMQNSSGGALELYDIANGQFSGFHGIGSVGTSWQVLGFGDFSGNAGESDMLMRDSGTGNMELYDIANNSLVGSYSMGSVGTSWQVLGFGDFSGHAGEDDMLMRDSSTGNVELYDINNNGYAGFYSMGAIGTSWQVLGFGDFSGNIGEDDMLMRDSTTGNLELYDINNNGYAGFYSLGAIGTSWVPVGVGDFSGNANESDLLMRNSGTGEFELYDITGNAITKAVDLGGVGTSWTVTGIADPPGGAAPANAQLVQAMANYASSVGALDTTSPLGQTATQPAAASLFVPPSGQPPPT